VKASYNAVRSAGRNTMHVGEHDDEALPGLPAPLPAGERLLWRGAPDWRVLARRSFHLRKVAVYFGVLIAWRFITAMVDGGSLGDAAVATLWTLPLAGLALGLIALLSWLVASNTVYTLTDRRVVMRIGVVLTVTFNLPLRRIETARLHALPGGAGDIALVLDPADRIGYIHLWPHARPWHFARTEPMLRALPDAQAVARLLADALQQSMLKPVLKPVRVVAERAGATPPQPVSAGHGGHPPMANAA
jgi:Bacterial PH domain